MYLQQETRREGSDFDIGANASQEEQADSLEDSGIISGINVCLDNRLTETAFAGKKDYQKYIKGYMGSIKKRLEDDDKTAELDKFQSGMASFMKEMMKEFSEYQFYQRE